MMLVAAMVVVVVMVVIVVVMTMALIRMTFALMWVAGHVWILRDRQFPTLRVGFRS